MKAKEILGENFNEEDLEEAYGKNLPPKEGKADPSKEVFTKREASVEYEDMTEVQQKIVDVGLSGKYITMPNNMSPEEIREWLKKFRNGDFKDQFK